MGNWSVKKYNWRFLVHIVYDRIGIFGVLFRNRAAKLHLNMVCYRLRVTAGVLCHRLYPGLQLTYSIDSTLSP